MGRFQDPELIHRCEAFWSAGETDRPLVGAWVMSYYPLEFFTKGLTEKRVRPQDLTAAAFLDDCERRVRDNKAVRGDAVWVAGPSLGMPWLEGIMGCPIKADAGTAWAEPIPEDWREFDRTSVLRDNDWFNKLNELTVAAVERSNGHFPVGAAHLRGPSDAAAAMLGNEQLCLSTYDHPADLKRLMDVCLDIWLEVTYAQYKLVPTHGGGYWNASRPLWAPGQTMMAMVDVASMFSPQAFEEFLMPDLVRIAQAIPYCFLHLHSTFLHVVLDLVLELDDMRAIQVGIDLVGPSVDDLLPMFKEIQARKPLLLDGALSAQQIRTLIDGLSPRGLCVFSLVDTPDQGNKLLEQVWER